MVLRLERRTLTLNVQRPTLKIAEFPVTTHTPEDTFSVRPLVNCHEGSRPGGALISQSKRT